MAALLVLHPCTSIPAKRSIHLSYSPALSHLKRILMVVSITLFTISIEERSSLLYGGEFFYDKIVLMRYVTLMPILAGFSNINCLL